MAQRLVQKLIDTFLAPLLASPGLAEASRGPLAPTRMARRRNDQGGYRRSDFRTYRLDQEGCRRDGGFFPECRGPRARERPPHRDPRLRDVPGEGSQVA